MNDFVVWGLIIPLIVGLCATYIMYVTNLPETICWWHTFNSMSRIQEIDINGKTAWICTIAFNNVPVGWIYQNRSFIPNSAWTFR